MKPAEKKVYGVHDNINYSLTPTSDTLNITKGIRFIYVSAKTLLQLISSNK